MLMPLTLLLLLAAALLERLDDAALAFGTILPMPNCLSTCAEQVV